MTHGNTKHGESNRGGRGTASPEYLAWKNIKERCLNENDAAYEHYGGRGISVCERWKESFEAFLEDMGRRPSPNHTLDRIDNDGDYTPENCRWATRQQQANNRRNNHEITFRGRTQTLTQWAREMGISRESLTWRLNEWDSVEKALTTPKGKVTNPTYNERPQTRWITFNGRTQTLTQWAEEIGITKQALSWRLDNWTKERALTETDN